MTEIRFYENADDELLKIAVIISKSQKNLYSVNTKAGIHGKFPEGIGKHSTR